MTLRDSNGRFVKGHTHSAEVLEKLSKTWFQKGHESSHNKGVKGWTNKGSFKKGHKVPKRWRQIISETHTTFPIGKNKLRKLYWNEKVSSPEIGKRIGVSGASVLRWMKRFGIPKRSPSEVGRLIEHTWGENISKAKMGHSVSEETRKKLREARMKQKMPSCYTKPELKLIEICERNKIPLVYTGDGSFWVSGINPDFIDYEKKLAVEVFGRYWHTPSDKVDVPFFRTYGGRKYIFITNGWTPIIFWEDELSEENVLDRLSEYYL